ncbi:MAG: ATP-dependent helicase [Lachnospiraceae bacterium]|nr:ATP-dependent helicase [Lachnospiraceae bacterium]
MEENRAQQEAIRHGAGPCMVIAGPGSGKTTVITHRVRYLTEELSVEPGHILVITFTRAAAEEMKSRYLKLTGRKQTEVTFGTFHAVFFNMLRYRFRLQETSVLKAYEKRRILSEVIRERFPGTGTEHTFLEGLIDEISKVKNNRLDPKQFRSQNGRVPFDRVYAAYAGKVREMGFVDYDDMLLLTFDMLARDRETLAFWRDRYRWILIDEYQDINPVQSDVIRMIAEPLNNLFVVGDDDQSVYRFRNASPELMLRFPEQYRKARKVQLDVNYRCSAAIVARSMKLIRHNRKRFRKKMRAYRDVRGEIETGSFGTPEEECAKVADRIEEVHAAGVPYEEVAVLFRTNASAGNLVSALTARKIPFLCRGHVENVFRHPVCVPVFAYLNLASGDWSRRNFLKCMNAPVRYIRRSDLTDSVVDPEGLAAMYEGDPERAWMADRIRFLLYQVGMLQRLKTPFAMVNYIRKGMEYDRHVLENAHAPASDARPEALRAGLAGVPDAAAESLRVLDELQASAAPFDTVKAWYGHIAAYTRTLEQAERVGGEQAEGRVLLSTLHGAKGLEFDTVILPDLNERVLPHEKAVTPDDVEEERRLFYVGMTRAKRKLVLYCTEERFGKRMAPSRFLREM